MKNLHYFHGSFAFTTIALVLGYLMGGWAGAYSVTVLAILETSLSVDNSVVNATKLETMSHFWRNMFLTLGMLIAIFGMRVIFPIAIVGESAGIDWFPSVTTALSNLFTGQHTPYNDNVLFMAIDSPVKYAAVLTDAHATIAGFGGAFLMLVFLKFFIDSEKEHHWLSIIEAPLAKLGKIEAVQIGITVLALYTFSTHLPAADSTRFFMAGIFGILTYIATDGLGALLDSEEGDGTSTTTVVKSGLAAFMYLEVLDASFSFDGVVGAFAITNNLFIIALGLGVGAMFVRSMTIMLVDKGTLSEFVFLEHGAFYAIGSLAGIMLCSTIMHIPEVISGTIGAIFIGVALWASIIYNRNKSNEIEPDVVHAAHVDHISIKDLKESAFYKNHQ
jgi:hypothetical protein